MNRVRTVVMFVPYVVVGLVHLSALATAHDDLASFTKPLLMPALIAALLFALPDWRTIVSLLASLALLFCLAGDVGISAPGDMSFLIALGFFFVAHVCYIVLFWRKLRLSRLPMIGLLYVLWWMVLVVTLAPYVGSMLVPVMLYGLILGAMGALALGCNGFIALGGVLFVISDSILALNKFFPDFRLWQVHVVIMLAYIAAQGLITVGIVVWAWRRRALEALMAAGDSEADAAAGRDADAAAARLSGGNASTAADDVQPGTTA